MISDVPPPIGNVYLFTKIGGTEPKMAYNILSYLQCPKPVDVEHGLFYD